MPGLRVCVDVDDLERGIAFYARAFGFTVARRVGAVFAELAGAPVPIDVVAHAAGSAASPATGARRDYGRHWTPVHLDLVVDDVDAAVARATEAGAKVEVEAQDRPFGRIAVLADPFGHGFCLLKLHGRGYDAAAGGSDAPSGGRPAS